MELSIIFAAVFSAVVIASAVPNPDAVADDSDVFQLEKRRDCYDSGCGNPCRQGYKIEKATICGSPGRVPLFNRVCC
ncbi:hypothetical protein FPQ18DRAFT_345015, partial [Pyronema domesticum]